MIKVQPQGQIYLCKTPLENDYKNQLTFTSQANQTAYFASTVVRSYDNNTYIHKDGGVKINCNAEDIRSCNYMFYKNTGFDNRIYYCFITKIDYVSENSTFVQFETDCFQTWYFDLVYKPCFVEREHVNDDTVGLHTVPEGLETGEYVVNGDIQNSDLNPSSTENNLTWICFQVSDFPKPYTEVDSKSQLNPGLGDDVNGRLYGGVYSGLSYLMVLTSTMANRLIKCYDLDGKSDAIVSIFQVPYGAINTDHLSITNQTSNAGAITIAQFTNDSLVPITLDTITMTKPTTIDSYTPKNNKVLTYPYAYFYASNNAGIDAEYHWEDFSSNPSFSIEGVVSQGMSIKAYPTNYKRSTNIGGYNFGLTCGKMPVCAWNSDYYTNW